MLTTTERNQKSTKFFNFFFHELNPTNTPASAVDTAALFYPHLQYPGPIQGDVIKK